jgi:hypothetical protein
MVRRLQLVSPPRTIQCPACGRLVRRKQDGTPYFHHMPDVLLGRNVITGRVESYGGPPCPGAGRPA